MSRAQREDDTPTERPRRAGHWVYVAVGGAIVDHTGAVRKILHLSPKLDDLTYERTKPLLQEVERRMVTFAPAKLCETGRQINATIDATIERWEQKHTANIGLKRPKNS